MKEEVLSFQKLPTDPKFIKMRESYVDLKMFVQFFFAGKQNFRDDFLKPLRKSRFSKKSIFENRCIQGGVMGVPKCNGCYIYPESRNS